MRIHLNYIDYEIIPEKDDFRIINIKIKDESMPMSHIFIDLAQRCTVSKLVDICTTVEQLNVYVHALNYGIMEMRDPSNGLEL